VHPFIRQSIDRLSQAIRSLVPLRTTGVAGQTEEVRRLCTKTLLIGRSPITATAWKACVTGWGQIVEWFHYTHPLPVQVYAGCMKH